MTHKGKIIYKEQIRNGADFLGRPSRRSWPNQGEIKLCGSRVGPFIPCTPTSATVLCRPPPSHSQILVCVVLMNSAGHILMALRPSPIQRSECTSQLVVGLRVPWKFCWVALDSALVPSLNPHQSVEHQSTLSGDSLRTYFMQLATSQRQP